MNVLHARCDVALLVYNDEVANVKSLLLPFAMIRLKPKNTETNRPWVMSK